MCRHGPGSTGSNGGLKSYSRKCYICTPRWSKLAIARSFDIEEEIRWYLFCNPVSHLLVLFFFSFPAPTLPLYFSWQSCILISPCLVCTSMHAPTVKYYSNDKKCIFWYIFTSMWNFYSCLHNCLYLNI